MHLLSLSLTALLATQVSTSPTVDKRAISCLKVGATATASWTNAAGQTCRWSGVVGSNFGTNSVNRGEYSCNGRCGAGCSGTAIGNVYTQDCFSHDVCSWFNNASGGASDRNCGAAYNAAIDDTIGGAAAGCGQTNPSNAAVRPSTSPTCS
ncbi:hypothetical protein PtrSN002B_010820 [Pyrenophora tritici-repentis]|uniref:Exosortase-EpsH domain containing protein n=2 Tax=Pyrenophora tritici-repentis TaxID=45151 RepID=A0A2W1DAF2_9PLEO|nr:uncharacterized protein PTRG_11014 [Pyrenophora tritici-repentis Pt-1C-BFP]KAA8618193.1 hypothetical protein PtrV1_09700 [Pyrenophora tritici-repentis]EDU44064.1 conserved hypothetical protein [Pyrenophora tritici-repentis Pt-1C-BFP]KAF7442846.1 hypothetical protein A1F99_123530 [Pyrenophora tritici-repentis]KAF7568700.1 Exosortase-EpsH domain containing protein [Pyrenophora tritici-repentis]KAG9376360.1 hypothetical protein A1F94_012907 [Pyrenophora tritici-repentis]